MSKNEKVPANAEFELILSKTIQGETALPDAKCQFNYHWDFNENRGIAHLLDLDGQSVNIVLHPLGIKGLLAFMSDIPPTKYVINGKNVIIYRVILDISLETGERSAAIMFGEGGENIQTTKDGLNPNDEKYQLEA